MKKFKLLALIVLVIGFTTTFSSCGSDDSDPTPQEEDQYTVTVDNTILNDGDTWVTQATGEEGNMKLSIKNVSDEVIYLKIKVTDMSDNVPAQNDIELCLGECYFSIAQNAIYPTGTPYSLQPGQTSPDGAAHVKNNDNRNGDIILSFKLFQTDAQGNELTNKKTVSFTYKYQAP